MQKLLYPSMYLSSLSFLDIEVLRENGIKAILFDLDNTIIRRDKDMFDAEVENWLRDLLNKGFFIAIVSNNSSQRVDSLAEPLGMPTVSKAMKPTKQAFLRGMELLQSTPENTAVLGDQIFTDILGGNRLGLFTILVEPMGGKEFWATRHVNRRMEKFVLLGIKRKINGEKGCFLLK